MRNFSYIIYENIDIINGFMNLIVNGFLTGYMKTLFFLLFFLSSEFVHIQIIVSRERVSQWFHARGFTKGSLGFTSVSRDFTCHP